MRIGMEWGLLAPRFGGFKNTFMLTKNYIVEVPGDDGQKHLGLNLRADIGGVAFLRIHIDGELCYDGLLLHNEVDALHEAVGAMRMVATEKGGSHE